MPNNLRNKAVEAEIDISINALEIQKLSEYLPSTKLDDYSFELHQESVDK